jgi:hypothetical protein
LRFNRDQKASKRCYECTQQSLDHEPSGFTTHPTPVFVAGAYAIAKLRHMVLKVSNADQLVF